MAYNFPSNPTLGQRHTSNDRTFEWNGLKWNPISTPSSTEGRPAYATVSASPPPNPQEGRLWYDTISSCLKIRLGSVWDFVMDIPQEVSTKVRISSSAPANPGVGDLWFSPENSFLSIWYEDTDSSQWVTIVPYVEDSPSGGGSGDIVNSTTVAGLLPSTIEFFDFSLYRSARIQIQVSQGGKYQSTDLIVIHDGTDVFITEYATITTEGLLASFDAFISGGLLQVQTSLENSASAVVKSITQKIPV